MSDHVDAHVRERYTIEERLGKGAYGIVWKAVDKVFNYELPKILFDRMCLSLDDLPSSFLRFFGYNCIKFFFL